MSSHGLPSVPLCVLISYKDTSHIELGPTYMTLFYLNCLFKALFPTTVTSHSEVLGIRAPNMNFKETQSGP